MPETSDPLAAALRSEPPAAIAALPEDVRTRLAEQIRSARHRQATVVDDAVRTAVKGVPLPVRGIVRKALL
ncbi:MAG: hypothetical protein ACR2LX_15035 [Jatrophihabitans sp.]